MKARSTFSASRMAAWARRDRIEALRSQLLCGKSYFSPHRSGAENFARLRRNQGGWHALSFK